MAQLIGIWFHGDANWRVDEHYDTSRLGTPWSPQVYLKAPKGEHESYLEEIKTLLSGIKNSIGNCGECYSEGLNRLRDYLKEHSEVRIYVQTIASGNP